MEETDNILSPFCFAEGMKHDAETNVLFFLACLQVATPGVQTKPNAKYHSIFFQGHVICQALYYNTTVFWFPKCLLEVIHENPNPDKP